MSNRESISVEDIIGDIRNHRIKYTLFIVIALALGLAYIMITPAKYQAETMLVPVVEENSSSLGGLPGGLGNIASLAGIQLGRKILQTSIAIETMKSRKFSIEFINEHNLKPKLFPHEWDEKREKWKDREPLDTAAFIHFQAGLSIFEDAKSGLVEVKLLSYDPDVSANMLNELIKQINFKEKRDRLGESTRNLEFLNAELGRVGEIELKQTLYNLIETEQRNKMLLHARDEVIFKVIDPAVAPGEKYSPKNKLILTICLLGSIMAIVFVSITKTIYFSGR